MLQFKNKKPEKESIKNRESQCSFHLHLSNRQKAAHLLEAVFDECLTSRQAINKWPCVLGPDRSLDTAYQALMHFEADEEQQQTELFYIDAQLELLIQMVAYLSKDEPLPPYMLKAYEEEAREFGTGYYQDSHVLWAPFGQAARFFDAGIQVFREAFSLLK